MTKIILSLLITLLPASVQVDRQSDAYKLGYAEGRMDGFAVSVGIQGFHRCLETLKTPENCWADQIKSTTDIYDQWGKMSERERIKYHAGAESQRWINNLRGRGGETDLPRYLR